MCFLVFSYHLLQLLPRWLPHWCLHQRLPWCLLSTLHQPGLRWAYWTLHSLHGQLWWLQLLWPHCQGFQTVGVQQASVAKWSIEVFREVPALYSLFPGLWVSSRQRILLYLWVWINLGPALQPLHITLCNYCNNIHKFNKSSENMNWNWPLQISAKFEFCCHSGAVTWSNNSANYTTHSLNAVFQMHQHVQTILLTFVMFNISWFDSRFCYLHLCFFLALNLKKLHKSFLAYLLSNNFIASK